LDISLTPAVTVGVNGLAILVSLARLGQVELLDPRSWLLQFRLLTIGSDLQYSLIVFLAKFRDPFAWRLHLSQ